MQPTVFTFIKKDVGWYIDLPAYLEQGGFPDDLEMIMGADTMLELYWQVSGTTVCAEGVRSTKRNIWITK